MNAINSASDVVVVDYGLGNLFSLERAFIKIGCNPTITSDKHLVSSSAAVVLPGVGAFKDGMERLKHLQLVDSICDVAKSGRPVLGICLGMQLLFQESEEFGLTTGLELIKGKVVRLANQSSAGERVKIPHIGWNALHPVNSSSTWRSTLLKGIGFGESAYFVHSYVPVPSDDNNVVAIMSYGGHSYCAAVQQANIYGVQFHPEKSSNIGLDILNNFLEKIQ